jgi:hypothetical protein
MKDFMRNTGNDTGSNSFAYYTREASQIVQLPVLVNSFGNPLTPGKRIYMPENPIINGQMTIGLLAYNANFGNISNNVANPPGANVGAVGLAEFLLVTFCDINGVELLKRMPYNELCRVNRKYLPVFSKIATHRSYFSVTNSAPVLSAPAVANIVYFLRPLIK